MRGYYLCTSILVLVVVIYSKTKSLHSADFGLVGFLNGPINLLSDRLLRYVLIFEYQILVLDLVVDIRTKISEGI